MFKISRKTFLFEIYFQNKSQIKRNEDLAFLLDAIFILFSNSSLGLGPVFENIV